jgi:hypothetical protein
LHATSTSKVPQHTHHKQRGRTTFGLDAEFPTRKRATIQARSKLLFVSYDGQDIEVGVKAEHAGPPRSKNRANVWIAKPMCGDYDDVCEVMFLFYFINFHFKQRIPTKATAVPLPLQSLPHPR